MKEIDGGLEKVPGFQFSTVACGIRYEQRLDYALIASETPCNAAGVFTINKITAAPVRLCRERIKNKIHAILINATNANACTGDEGYENAKILTEDIASQLSVPNDSVLMASTGIIGRQLPVEKMKSSHVKLINLLSQDRGADIPKAIMTTDTIPKRHCISFETSKGECRIAGTAKGAGMIAPNMATLLAFIITDASIAADSLDTIFRHGVDQTLNAITIDGDMSTNDSAILLSPSSGKIITSKADLDRFEEALSALLHALATMLVSDGEGTTKVVTVRVINARDDKDAQMIARAVSESVLVKTALFGNDPNWGRIAAAAGYSGAFVKESSLSIYYNNLVLLDKGSPIPFQRDTIDGIIKNKKFTITIDIGLGNGEATMLTTDLSYEYVKINAEYST